jgi:2-polyprenyl-3-methyl-5-hydroxy-6-metoxy-1,4-benzoquinol methylase
MKVSSSVDKNDPNKVFRSWEYEHHGDYHRNLDPNWSYTPTYLKKMAFVKKFIATLSEKANILDAGCGEGVLVDEMRAQGRQIQGIDLNYASQLVQRGSILHLPYKNETFDLVLLLDVFEHLQYADQPQALEEIYRVLKTNGKFLASIPNLAHLNSRFRFSIAGKLDRTDIETNHGGERPFSENFKLLQNAGFDIVGTKGITFTAPILYRWVICRRPAWFRWLHDLLEPLAIPSLAMINIFVCQKLLR